MVAKSMRRLLVVAALALSVSFAAEATAQCCGTGYSAYYQPAAYTAYSPVAYTSYYGYYGGGWYPGYWLDRVRARVWGSPTTYVASYPSTYYASYAPSYSVGYRPAYSVGYTASYAAPACSSCSSCSSCGYSAAYSPCSSCTTSCAPCSSCAMSAAPAVTQAAYEQPAGCSSCGVPAAVMAPAPTMAAPSTQATPSQSTAPPPTYGSENGAPTLDPNVDVQSQRQQDTQRPPANGTQQEIQPEPTGDTKDPYKVDSDGSTFFQAPKLFDPNDRTARRSPRRPPVTTALYEKPVSYRSVSSRQITVQQAELDAAGWVSASR